MRGSLFAFRRRASCDWLNRTFREKRMAKSGERSYNRTPTMLERLYPGYKEHGWMPVIWLMYLIFFFIDPFLNHQGLLVWTGTIVAGAVFVLLYLRSYTSHGRTAVLAACAMVLMGIICTPWNSGAMGFFIYAAATVPWL